MAKQIRTTLKGYFETGDIPNQQQYQDLIDSFVSLDDTTVDPQIINTGLSSSGYLSAGTDITSSGHISASGNIYLTGFISASGDISGSTANFTSITGSLQAVDATISGDVTVANVSASGIISASEFRTYGIISASGAIRGSGSLWLGISGSGFKGLFVPSESGDNAALGYINLVSQQPISLDTMLGNPSEDTYIYGPPNGEYTINLGQHVNTHTKTSGKLQVTKDLDALQAITASGDIVGWTSVSSSGTLSGTHITGSGNISASGDLAITGNISGSKISASNSMYGYDYSIHDRKFANHSTDDSAGIEMGNSGAGNLLMAHITASGNISASGDITATGFISGSTVKAGAFQSTGITQLLGPTHLDLDDIPASDPGIKGQLYRLEVSAGRWAVYISN